MKLATVHAAKGLQWPAVFVPGFADGAQSHMFPAKPRISTRWTENARLLPFSLRGDAADLPALATLQKADLTAFSDACSARDLAEERRLGYVAATRAAYLLGCSGYWWSDGASRLGPSQFLTEVRAACEAGAGQVTHWHPEPEPDAANPALSEPATAVWLLLPPSRSWPRPARGGAGVAGALVDDAVRALRAATPQPESDPADPDAELMASWARDTDLLLAERSQRQPGQQVLVDLPRQLPVSSLVTIARDPAELAQQVRRPMPRRPVAQAARGTTFHQWLEQRFGQAQLIDADELPGAADDRPGPTGDVELGALEGRIRGRLMGERVARRGASAVR